MKEEENDYNYIFKFIDFGLSINLEECDNIFEKKKKICKHPLYKFNY
jgi:hypothetical protein